MWNKTNLFLKLDEEVLAVIPIQFDYKQVRTRAVMIDNYNTGPVVEPTEPVELVKPITKIDFVMRAPAEDYSDLSEELDSDEHDGNCGYGIFDSNSDETEDSDNNDGAEDLISNPDNTCVDEGFILSISNYNPVRASQFLAEYLQSHPKAIVCCDDMISYSILINAGMDHSDISITITNNSRPEYVTMVAQSPEYIKACNVCDVHNYITNLNKDNPEILTNLIIHGGCGGRMGYPRSQEYLINSCIAKYGSIANAPQELIDRLEMMMIMNIDSEVFEFQRPYIEYLATRGPIYSYSPMFEILFHGIPTTAKTGEDYMPICFVGYSRYCQDFEKEDFLSALHEKYDIRLLSRLYELHMTGFITSEDIVKSGLHYVYSICDWMINKTSKVKGCRATLSAQHEA